VLLSAVLSVLSMLWVVSACALARRWVVWCCCFAGGWHGRVVGSELRFKSLALALSHPLPLPAAPPLLPTRSPPPSHKQVCGVQTFTQVEDRPVLKERTERCGQGELGVGAG